MKKHIKIIDQKEYDKLVKDAEMWKQKAMDRWNHGSFLAFVMTCYIDKIADDFTEEAMKAIQENMDFFNKLEGMG